MSLLTQRPRPATLAGENPPAFEKVATEIGLGFMPGRKARASNVVVALRTSGLS
jgi:hypothetical protein